MHHRVKEFRAMLAPRLSAMCAGVRGALASYTRPTYRARPRSSDRSMHRAILFEPLEARLLLSADLVPAVQALHYEAPLLPGDALTQELALSNAGDEASPAGVVIDMYASLDDELDATDRKLASFATGAPIAPAAQVVLTGPLDTRLLHPGTYRLIAHVDATDRIAEADETDNVVVTTATFDVAWRFGQVPGRDGNLPLTVLDADGSRVSFGVVGNGSGQVSPTAQGFDLTLTGSDAATRLTIDVAHGDGRTRLHEVRVYGSLGELAAGTADLAGEMLIDGSIGKIVLADVARSQIAVAGAAAGARLSLDIDRAIDVVLTSAMPVDEITAHAWTGSGGPGGRITAPSLQRLAVQGDFAADLVLTGDANAPLILTSVQVGGSLGPGTWNVQGRSGQIHSGAIAESWKASFAEPVASIVTVADLGGEIALPALGVLQAGADLRNARIIVGADLGADGQVGGLAQDADTFVAGNLPRIRVAGAMIDARIWVGIDPVDGVFDNGNDRLAPGPGGQVREIGVGGLISQLSAIASQLVPAVTRVDQQSVATGNVPQIVTRPLDRVAPSLTAALANDTGLSTDDSLTNDATLAGAVTDFSAISSLAVALDSAAPGGFVDATSSLQPGGQFLLAPGILVDLAGGHLADGEHTVYLVASDAHGNVSSPVGVRFVLDTQAPLLQLDQPEEGEALGMLSGRVEGTGSAVARLLYTLPGRPAASVPFDADGKFAYPVPTDALDAGAHLLSLEGTDLAGNIGTVQRSVQIDRAFAISGHAPADGVTDVGVTARPRIQFSTAVDPGSVNAASFYASAGGAVLPGTVVVSSDARTAWLYVTGAMPGNSKVEITVEGDSIRSADDQVLDADGDGTPGGTLRFGFTTVSTVALSGTTLAGRVLDVGPDLLALTPDDVAPGDDGVVGTDDDVFLLPVAGVPVYLMGREQDVVMTGADGRFAFEAVPAGDIKLVIDGPSVAGAATFPQVILDVPLEPAAGNDLGNIHIPRMALDSYVAVAAGEQTVVTLPAENAFGLTAEQREQFTLTIAPESLLDAGGNPVAAGEVALAVVPVPLIAALLPAGLPAPILGFTIQTRGFSDFSVPARLTLPNVAGASPGTEFVLLTFDHTTRQLVADGTVVVTDEGNASLQITLDGAQASASGGNRLSSPPGSGVTYACFHVVVPGTSPVGPACEPAVDPATVEVPPQIVTFGIENYFFKDDDGSILLDIANVADPIDPTQGACSPVNAQATPLVLEITVEGPAGEFLEGLEGLAGTHTLLPGESFEAFLSVKDLLGAIANVERDRLYGARIGILGYASNNPGAPLIDESVHIYRFLDVADGAIDAAQSRLMHADGVVEFADTVDDGPSGVVRTRPVELRMSGQMAFDTRFTVDDNTHFPNPGTAAEFLFDPVATASGLTTTLNVVAPDGETAGTLKLLGQGTGKTQLFVDTASLRTLLAGIANGSADFNDKLITETERALFDTPEERTALAEAVAAEIIARYGAIAGGIELGGSLDAENTVSVIFKYFGSSSAEMGTSSPADGGGDGVDNIERIGQALQAAKEANRSPGEIAFLLSEALNQSAKSRVNVFLLPHLQNQSSPLTLAAQQIVNALAKTGAHEVAHSVGTMHAAKAQLVTERHEVQRIAFTDATGGITLSFENRTTAAIARDATQEEIEAALAALPNVGQNIQVSGSDGVFTVTFDNRTDSGLFRFIDVPQLVGQAVAGGTVQVSTLANGSSRLDVVALGGTVAQEIVLQGQSGRNDIMSQGFTDLAGAHAFTSGLSLELVKMGLKLDWTPVEAKRALAYASENFRLGGGSVFNQYGEGAEGFPLPGAHLSIIDPTSGAISGAVAMGEVPTDGAGGALAQRTLQLGSFGSEDVVVQQVELLGAAGHWRLAPVAPGTVLTPGETLALEVGFDPLATGGLEATLRIKASDTALAREIVLRGAGVSPAGDLRFEVANNNVGGQGLGAGAKTLNTYGVIRNIGAGALSISDVRMAGEAGAQFAILGLPQDLGTSPLVLAPGAEFTVGLAFDPTTIGLQRAAVEIVSDDADSPLLRHGVVGTGIAEGRSALDYGDDFVAVTLTGAGSATTVRTVSDASGNWRFFLPAGTRFHAAIHDPASGLIGHGFGVTAPTGIETRVDAVTYRASVAPDSDGDGLPDDIEAAIGSDAAKVDSDGDGLDDFVEIRARLDPSSARGAPTGIVGAVSLPGTAWDVAVAGPIGYVATGAHGLALVDISVPERPVFLTSVALAGTNVSVAVDEWLGMAAVAADFTDPGLHIVDVSDPAAPVVTRTITLPDGASHVEAFRGVAYVASGNALVAIELATGATLERLELGANALTGLAREAAMLYAMDAAGTLTIVDVSSGSMTPRGALSVAHGGGAVFVTGGIAYLANATGFRGGFATVDVTDADQPTLLSDSDVASGFRPETGVAADGSGRVLAIGDVPNPSNPFVSMPVLDVADASDPTDTNAWLARVPLPEYPLGIALAGGVALIADGSADLQIVRYRAADTAGLAPQVSLAAIVEDADPSTPGVQVAENALIELFVGAADDGLVRDVDLLIDGVPVSADSALGYEFFVTAARTGPMSVQARATDIGGNTGWSPRLVFEVIEDSFAPVLESVDPAPGAVLADGLRTVRARFSEALAAETVNPSTFFVRDDAGRTVASSELRLLAQGRVVELVFGGLPEGDYELVIVAPEVLDLAGNALGATDLVSGFSLSSATIRWIGAGGGLWSDPANWDLGRLPNAQDSVLIDLPNDVVTIVHDDGTSVIASLRSKESIRLTGGILDVTGTLRVDSALRLIGGTLRNALVHPVGSGLDVSIEGFVTLDAVTLLADVSVAPDATVLVMNGLTLDSSRISLLSAEMVFEGTQTLDGTGSVYFTGADAGNRLWAGDGGLTIGSGITVHGAQGGNVDGGTSGLVLRGLVLADAPGTSIRMQGAWINEGLVRARGGEVQLGGTFSFGERGTFDATGGTVALTGVLDNTGRELVLTEATGSLQANGGTIRGGRVEATNAAALEIATTLVLDAVVLASDLAIPDGRDLEMRNGLTLDAATVTLLDGTVAFVSPRLAAVGTQTLGGTGSIVFGGTGDSGRVTASSGSTLTIGAQVLVTGSRDGVVGVLGAVVNEGEIAADASGVQIDVTGPSVVNRGTMRAVNGGFILTGSFVNEGTVAIGGGTSGFRVLSANYVQTGGVTTITGGSLRANLIDIRGGTFSGFGTIHGPLKNAALLEIGGSGTAGTLQVNGTFEQTATGVLVMELGGTATSQYDRLNITGAATLLGRLRVELIGGFVPAPADSFTILAFASHSGEFDEIEGLDLGGGRLLAPTVLATQVRLTAS